MTSMKTVTKYEMTHLSPLKMNHNLTRYSTGKTAGNTIINEYINN